MTFLRSLIFVIYLYGSMVLLGILWLPAVLLPRSASLLGIRIWAHLAIWGMRWIMGASLEFRGKENLPDTPVLIAAKHQSMLDTLVPFILFKDPCIILKKELLWYPIFNIYALKTEMIAIDRSGSTKTLKEMTKKAKAARDKGRSLLIFPEGTRFPPGAAPDYKPGIAFLYRELDLGCLPIALNTGLCWPGKGMMRKPGKMVIECLPVIEPGLTRKTFMAELETRIETASAKLLEEGLAAQGGKLTSDT